MAPNHCTIFSKEKNSPIINIKKGAKNSSHQWFLSPITHTFHSHDSCALRSRKNNKA